MKTKTFSLVTAAAVALGGSASAIVTPAGNQTIDIAGSTAGRSTVHDNIITQLGGAANVAIRYFRTNGATLAPASASGADGAIYKGTFNSQTVIVRTFWAGSASGVDIVSNQTSLAGKLLDLSVINSAAANTVSQVGAGNLISAPANAALLQSTADVAEFGYSDVKQAATPYQTNPLASQTDMFVIPFAMYRTETLTGVTNVTNQQLRSMFTGGGIAPKSLFTGLPSDRATFVRAVGRDDDSGTRITFAAETGIGVFTGMNQFTYTVSGSGSSANIATPVATTPNGGYASGGDLRVVLGATGDNCIGYLGLSDGATAAGLGAVQLSFNGTPFSQDAVKDGSYTFWSYYQSILSSATSDANALALHVSLETALTSVASSNVSIKISEMQVSRQADGATVDF